MILPASRICSLLLFLAGGTLLAEQSWLGVKAQLAEILIARAFKAHLRDGGAHRPWSWADTHPIARLEVSRLEIERTVLAGGSGGSLAFGPGHVDGSAHPNSSGNCVLAGHRDSWFAFLADLRLGDEIILRDHSGPQSYRVSDLRVHSMWDDAVLESGAGQTLTLITCYPFGALRSGELRYVVTAHPAPQMPRTEPDLPDQAFGTTSNSVLDRDLLSDQG